MQDARQPWFLTNYEDLHDQNIMYKSCRCPRGSWETSCPGNSNSHLSKFAHMGDYTHINLQLDNMQLRVQVAFAPFLGVDRGINFGTLHPAVQTTLIALLLEFRPQLWLPQVG